MWHVELGIKPPSADNYVSCESQLSRVISVSCFFSSLEDKNNLRLTACTEKGFSSPLSCAQIHTSSCVSVRERWRTRPPLFFQQTCARPQTRSRELPASARPAFGKHRAQKATAAEKQEKRKRFSLNSSPHAVFREATERGENIKIRQIVFYILLCWTQTLKAGFGMRLWKSSQGDVIFTGMAHFLFSSVFSFSFDFSSFPFSGGDEDDAASCRQRRRKQSFRAVHI